jgi:hypothetical protein
MNLAVTFGSVRARSPGLVSAGNSLAAGRAIELVARQTGLSVLGMSEKPSRQERESRYERPLKSVLPKTVALLS